MNDEQVIDEVIQREGREYVNHPADRGGPTRYGITIRTLSRYRRRFCTAYDVETLSEAEARAIYRSEFIVRPRFHLIDDPEVRGFLVDSGIQHSPETATKFAQRVLGLTVDGVCGPITRAAINEARPQTLLASMIAERVIFYGTIVTDDPVRMSATKAGYRTQAENAKGWARRAAEFIRRVGRPNLSGASGCGNVARGASPYSE